MATKGASLEDFAFAIREGQQAFKTNIPDCNTLQTLHTN